MPAERSASHEVAGRAPSIYNAANALTMVRILLVPVLGVLLVAHGGNHVSLRIWAFVVFFAAMATDRMDGDVARKHNLVTDVGKVMDPIADKALTGMALVGLSLIGELWWWVTILVLGRELLVTGLRLVVIRYGVIAASRGGKIKTTLQAFALMGLILPFRRLPGGWHFVGVVLWWGAVVVMAAAVVVTLVTGADYVRRAAQLRRAGLATAKTAR